jgi:hypothetical protein
MSRLQQAYAWGLAIVAVVALVASGAFQSIANLAFPAAISITLLVCLALSHREPSSTSRLMVGAIAGVLIGLGSFYLTGTPIEASLTAVGSALAIALLPPSLAAARKQKESQA